MFWDLSSRELVTSVPDYGSRWKLIPIVSGSGRSNHEDSAVHVQLPQTRVLSPVDIGQLRGLSRSNLRIFCVADLWCHREGFPQLRLELNGCTKVGRARLKQRAPRASSIISDLIRIKRTETAHIREATSVQAKPWHPRLSCIPRQGMLAFR
jgi:hypothetical protein